MRRQYPSHPLVGVGAIIIEQGRVALVKRGRAPLLGHWSIPGGMLELGESLRQGAEREAREETGLVVEAAEMLGVFERILPDQRQRTRYHYVLIDFLCQRVGGRLRASGDAADVGWFSPDQLEGLELAEDTARVIGEAFERSAHRQTKTRRSGELRVRRQLAARQR